MTLQNKQGTWRQGVVITADFELREFIKEWRNRHGLSSLEEAVILHKYQKISAIMLRIEDPETYENLRAAIGDAPRGSRKRK